MIFSANDINRHNCWQIGTGDETRSYFDIFLKYGVALVGPGDPGREGDPKTELYYKLHLADRNWGKVLKEIRLNEWIIARKGKRTILAIGQVYKEIEHSDFFSDVEGWDLQHYVKVKWYIPNNLDKKIQFGSSVLSQSTLQQCHNHIVYNQIYNTEFIESEPEFDLEDFPLPKTIDHSDLTKMIIDKGLRIQDAENIALTIQRIIKLAQWYRQNDNKTLEFEIISFLILPLLIALGWSEQKVKLEYQKIDIAMFNDAFKGNYQATPKFIIEAKSFGNGLAFTEEQIKSYADKYPNCKNFIATNGFRYKIFVKDNDTMLQTGYFNLLRLNERNVLYDIPNTTIESIFSISNLH